MSSRIQPEVPVQETGSNTIVEKRYQNMKTKDTKYTDVTRTSSASFKPPMSKDSTVRKPVETQQQRDSSWFSYIKNMFGTKPPADNPVKDLENKIDTVRMKSVPAKETRYERPVKSVKAEVTKPLAEGPKTSPIRQKEQPSAMLGVLEQKTKPQNVSSSPAVIKNQKDNTITNTSSTLISPMEEEIEGQYKSFRNGENASTFLHAPDKRGTTSFRITTNPKLCKPQPTLLSPTVLSKVKKPTKLGRKSSTSPRKVSPKDTSGPHSRLRSKSTPDSSNARPRPPYNPPSARRREDSNKLAIAEVNEDKASLQKAVGKRSPSPRITSQYSTLQEKRKNPTKPSEKVEEPVKQKSPIVKFFSDMMTPSEQNEKKEKDSRDKDSTSPTRQKLETAVGVAVGVLSTKLSEIAKQKAEEEKDAKEKKTKKRPMSPNQGSNAGTTRANEETPTRDDSPLRDTLNALTSLVKEKISPIVNRNSPDSSPNRIEEFERSPVREESARKRPLSPYLKAKKDAAKKSSSQTSQVRKFKRIESPERTTQNTKKTQVKAETSPKPKTEDMTLASAFNMLASMVQERLSPVIETKPRPTPKAPSPEPSPQSENKVERHFAYLKNAKKPVQNSPKSVGSHNAMKHPAKNKSHDTDSVSTFLRSRQTKPMSSAGSALSASRSSSSDRSPYRVASSASNIK